jgi:parallel beta-helix repeat protein
MATPGLAPHFYALPNGAFIQNQSGDEQVILEDVSGSISDLQAAIDGARVDYPNAFLLIRLKPNGLYTVTASPLVIGSKMCLTGNGSRIEAAGANITASSLLRIAPGSSFASISNVVLNGKLASVRGIEAVGVSRVNIDNIVVRNTGAAGIFLQGLGIDVFDSQITVAKCDIADSSSLAGIYLKSAAQAVCIENTCVRNPVGILLEGISRSTVANNQCLENSSFGLSLSSNSTTSNVFNNLLSGNPVAISLDASTVRNTFASNEIRSANTGIALSGTAHTLYDNVFSSAVTTPVQTSSNNHHIVTISTGFITSGQNYFYPPTVPNDHSSTIITGKANTNVTTAASTFSQIQAAYNAARAANPANTTVLRLTAPVITGDATLTLSSNTSVVITGRVNLAPGVTGFSSTNSTFVSISGGIIDGGNTAGRRGIDFDGCSRVLIDRVALQNFGDKNTRVTGSDLISFSKGGTPCIVANCTLNGGAARGIWTVDATARFLFTDNTISNVNMDGIDLDAYTNSALVKFNTVSNCVRSGIFVEEGAKHNQVIGNFVSSNPIAINLYAYDIDLTSYNSIIANTCTANTRGIRVGARAAKSTEHNFLFGNTLSQTGPQSALDAQVSGPENYFSQNLLLNNADDIGSTSAVFFNSPAHNSPSIPVVSYSTAEGLNGTFFQHQIHATHNPTIYTVAAGSVPLGLSLNATTGLLSGVPVQPGTFPLEITASNALGTSSPQTVQVVIQTLHAVTQPVITSATSAIGQVGIAFSHQIQAANSPTYFFGTSIPSGLTLNSATGLITGTPISNGNFTAQIYAANSGGTSNQTLTIAVTSTPVITSANTSNGTMGSAYSYQITATNNPTQFTATGLPTGLTINSTTGLIRGIPLQDGSFAATISAINASGVGNQTLNLLIAPMAPRITSAGTATAQVGRSFSYRITASSLPMTYGALNLPSGLSLNATSGEIGGIPTTVGNATVTISVSNSAGTASRTLVLTIHPPTPVITSASTSNGTFATAYRHQITATNTPTEFASTSLPSGLAMNAKTGLISGTPLLDGTFTAKIFATNAGGTANQTLTFVIASLMPRLTSLGTATAQVGSPFYYRITATNLAKSYGALNLPSGLTLNATRGEISGIPTTVGNTTVTISASNGAGTASRSLSITILPPAPVITSAATSVATFGTACNHQITASNSPSLYSVLSLPLGLTLDTKTGLISGTPKTDGSFVARISATNAGGTGTQMLTFTIAPKVPQITSPSTASAQVGKSFSYSIGAANIPRSYGASNLPIGLTINTTSGKISGIPTAAGPSTITISASNAAGTHSRALSLSILPAAPLITSASTSSGTKGGSYSYQATAINNPTSFAASPLPTGLTMNASTGLLSGIPLVSGNFSIIITSSNAGGTSAQKHTLRIANSGN